MVLVEKNDALGTNGLMKRKPLYAATAWKIKQLSLSKKRKKFLTHILECRSTHPEVFCEKVFLEISQNSQRNTCARVSFFIKLKAWGLQLY